MKWEYSTRNFRAHVHGDLEDFLNGYGEKGWELSQMIGQVKGRSTDENHGHGWRDESEFLLVFKKMVIE